jgi:uncharacterized damage-inducible protein DinB
MILEEQKFPIGRYKKTETITTELLEQWINDIAHFPKKIKDAVEYLNDEQLDTPYRPEGWTIRQVVHHCADSHMNSFMRFKLALTEDKPTIKPYFEDRWAELEDSKTFPIKSSIQLLEALHARWTILLQNMEDKDLRRTFIHPEHGEEVQLDENIGIYAWHCNHHLAHITTLKQQKGWK